MQAVIDRVVENTAVLLFEEQGLEVNVPMQLLPPEAGEGTWLNVSFAVDEETGRGMYQRNKALLNKLIRKFRDRTVD